MKKIGIIAVVLIAILLLQTPIYSNIAKNATSTVNTKTNTDKDGDGVSDDYEYSTFNVTPFGDVVYKLDPDEYDSWYDGLSDGQKVALGLVDRIRAQDSEAWISSAGDQDGDGLRDDIEVALGLDPLKFDTDDDGIPDSVEIEYFNTDPLNPDCDGDGLPDGYEISNQLVALGDGGVYLALYEIDTPMLPEDTDPWNPDTDGDGLSDWEEFNISFEGIGTNGTDEEDHLLWHGPDPTKYDTDGDGLSDKQELDVITEEFGGTYSVDNYQEVYTYKKAATTVDTDGDGLSDYEEWILGSNTTRDDSDIDGLTDSQEVMYGTDPLNPDTDGDGISDDDEIHITHTDPLSSDTDGDGLNDSTEIRSMYLNATNPDTDGDGLGDYEEFAVYDTRPDMIDSDSDNLNDSQEISYGTDPLKEDTDGDGLDDYIEIELGTNPNLNDTDGDGLNDWYEWQYGTNPNNKDCDGDGLSDYQEYLNKTDPWNPDTDGDGIPDGSDTTPGTSTYWDSSHYLPSVIIYSIVSNYRPGEYTSVDVTLHGNVGTVNITVDGPGKTNITSIYYNGTGWKDYYINLTFLDFNGNNSVVTLYFEPQNADPVWTDFNVINPYTDVTVSTSALPLNFPTVVYFNFTHDVKIFSLNMSSTYGSYKIVEISGKTVKVNFTMTSAGNVPVKIWADIYNASNCVRELRFVVGQDKFAVYEEKLNSVIQKVRNYINVSVNIDDIRNRYYSGDKSALEDLKSIIRVETLTLTAAVMLSQFVDELATTAVDIVSFKTLLNILMDKIKESETYKELVEYITNKLNSLASKIIEGLNVDEDLIDQIVDTVTEKAGESLDSTIQEYRDALKNKFVEWMYAPLKTAHDEIVYQYLSENESRERRLKIYAYAEEGVGMINLLSTISTVSESIEETSSLIGDFLNGVPNYKVAMEIVEKAAAILAKAASAMQKFEATATLNNIIAAYRGDTKVTLPSSTTRTTRDNYVFVYDVSNNGDIMTSLENILAENYTDATAILEQIKISTTIFRFISLNGTLAMLNSTAERYELTVENYQAEWNSSIVKINAPDTVIAGKSFNITVTLNFNATISLENESVYGDHANFTLSLPEGNYTLHLSINDVTKEINITAVNISALNWNFAGDVIYSVTPYGILSINAEDYNLTPENLLQTYSNETSSGGGENDNTNNQQETTSTGGVSIYEIICAITVVAAVSVTVVALMHRKKMHKSRNKRDGPSKQ